MQMFEDHMPPEDNLSNQVADRIWTCVRIAHERVERLEQKWRAAIEAVQKAGSGGTVQP